jgi:drug/metabolite transporter (DMT)-like permease
MLRAYLYTLIAVFTWGSSLAVNKAIVVAARGGARLTPTQVAFWCIAIGWLSLLLVLLARRRLHLLRSIAGRGWIVLLAMGCCGWVGSVVFLNIAFARLPLPDAIVINYLHPVFTVAFQGLSFSAIVRLISGSEQPVDRSRRPGPLALASGLLICLLGVAFIATKGKLTTVGDIGSAAGALAALSAAISWGIYSNLGRFVTMKPGRRGHSLSDLHTFAAMTFGLAIMGSLLAARGELDLPNGYYTTMFLLGRGPETVNAWPLIIGMGVVVYGLGFTMWLYAMELGARTGVAHKLPPLAYLSPVLGVAVGWALLREGFGPGFWPGTALIVLGNIANLIAGRRAPA